MSCCMWLAGWPLSSAAVRQCSRGDRAGRPVERRLPLLAALHQHVGGGHQLELALVAAGGLAQVQADCHQVGQGVAVLGVLLKGLQWE